jgi:hypothetical protein
MTNTTTLNLAERPAKIGSSINTRSESHGDENVPACDIPLTGIMLEPGELDALLGKGAHKAFFRDGKLAEPRFEALKEFALRDKFDGDVSIEIDDTRIDFDDEHVTLNAVKLEPQVGGMTALSLQLQCTPTTAEIATLVSSLNLAVRVEVTFGGRRQPKAKKQRELPMSHTATDGADDEQAATH